ncbi:MAG TPA: DUF2243 domain-containing protein [Gemmatimonadales bacterium]|nr:DUF2243 domain-containing protein [Gemmatimonadales bacterium]
MHSAEPRPSWRAGIILGIGLGGFVDGILLHQIVHWHNMGSAVVPPTTLESLQLNMTWDGLFHAGVWLITLLGVYLLLGDARRGARLPAAGPFTGLLLLGWGIFNLIEGLVDHHFLDLHHVRDLPVHVPLYDWLFLGVGGLGLILLGWALARRDGGEPGWTGESPGARAGARGTPAAGSTAEG